MPVYPKNILYTNPQGKGTFTLKIQNVGLALVLCRFTIDAGKMCVLSTIVDGSPSSISIKTIHNELINLKPCRKNGDSALYFVVEGDNVVGRTFEINIYNSSKKNIEYAITDGVDNDLIYIN